MGINNAGTVNTPSDDQVNVTLNFLFKNPGIYDIYARLIHMDIYIQDSANHTLLPPGALLGSVANTSYYFPAMSEKNATLTVEIESTYLPGLFKYNATLQLDISIRDAGFAGIKFDLDAEIFVFWDHTKYFG